jgi:anti-sigma B factor antagonist
MNLEIRNETQAAVVTLEGDVDLESSPQVRTALLECVGRKQPVVVDMSAVSYIDSSGVASLVEAFQAARKHRTPFVLAQVSEAALRVLELARLDRVFTIVGDVEDALNDG